MDLKEKLGRYKKKILVLGIPVGILVTLCIGFGSYYGYYALGNKALPGVKIGNVKVHGKTRAQLIANLEKANEKIRISFSNNDSKKSYSLSELGYKLDPKATADKALNYNKSFKNYFRALFKGYTVVPVFTIDGEKLINVSNQLSTSYSKAVPAVEPTIKFDENAGDFKPVAGKTGIGVQPESIINAAKKAIYEQKDLKAPATYGEVKPVATEAEVNTLTQEANKLLALEIKINANVSNTNKEFKADKPTIASWISLPLAASKAKPTFITEKSHEWLQNVKDKVVVAPVQGYKYISPSGSILKVVTEAKDGVEVSNLDNIKNALEDSLKNGKNYTGTLETKINKADWKTKTLAPGAENLPYPASPGEKWIDVNLSNHTISAYVGATRVRGPETVYTGNVSAGHATVVGTYPIYAKLKSQTMRGPDYVAPDVPNVMYFYGGYAVHGAPWVNKYLDQNNGRGWGTSHGCVNIPSRDGLDAWYYNWAPTRTIVRTHY